MQYVGTPDVQRSVVLLWDAEAAPARGPRPRVGKCEIVDAAIAIADGDGLDGLTMRVLADRVGVSPMALYPRIDGKAVLLDLMVDRTLEQLADSDHPPGTNWRARVERDAVATWDLHHRHPWLSSIGAGRSGCGPAELAVLERQLAAFDGLGLPMEVMGEFVGLVGSYVRGAVRAAIEAEQAPRLTGIGHEEHWRRQGRALAGVLDESARQRLPRLREAGILTALVDGSMGTTNDLVGAAATSFRRGLAIVLDGVAARITTVTGAATVT